MTNKEPKILNSKFSEKQAAKKATVLEAGRNRKKYLPLLGAAAGVIILIVAALFFFKQQGETSIAVAQDREIVRPVSFFEDGKARHFELETDGGLTIKYFVIKSSDGVIRAAFDACDVCWPSGRGYVQSGDHMVCRNCGRRFESVRVNEVKGGCNPAPLTRKIVDGNLVIRARDIIEEGGKYFNFKRKPA